MMLFTVLMKLTITLLTNTCVVTLAIVKPIQPDKKSILNIAITFTKNSIDKKNQ